MKYQKAKMVKEFIVPVGVESYGPRTTEAHWQKYAEHDMLQHLKDIEDIPEEYRDTSQGGDVSFEWGEQFEG